MSFAEWASGMGVDRIDELHDIASEGQAADCMGQILQCDLWQGREPGMWGPGLKLIQINSLQSLGGWRNMIEGTRLVDAD